jgi:hypothetical protein
MVKKAISKKTWDVVKMRLDDLTPASYNPRKISVEAFQGLGKSISKFGLMIPLVWNKRTGNIVGGHQRFRYLLEQGEMETDVVVVDLTDNDEVALNVALNNTKIRGDFTVDVIGLLEKSEVQLGSSFNDIGLAALFKDMNKEFEKELKKMNQAQEPLKQQKVEVKESGSKVEERTEEDNAVITCPKCKSKWKMKNNEVICNKAGDRGI